MSTSGSAALSVGLVARPLLGKSALVTGGSRGIGAAIVKAFAAAGADVAFSYSSSAKESAAVVAAVEAAGQKGYAIQADHAQQDQVVALVHEAARKLGKIDILVNNAGVIASAHTLDAATGTKEQEEQLARLWAINLTSVGTAVRTAAKYLTANPSGRIINIGSMVGEAVGFAGVADYSASKSALLSYTKGWARDFSGKNVTVNLIQPGPVETDMNPVTGPLGHLSRSSPAGRHGQPEEIAAAVLFVASPAASYVNAAIINVDGGYNA